MSIENISVAMIRPTLENLPTFAVPVGYHLRWYQPDDEEAWVAIHVAADPYHQFSRAIFAQEFSTDQALLAERQAYLCPVREDGSEGAPVGTAAAWFGVEEARRSEGLIHWVAIHPAHQGKGLAKPLLATVCHRLRALGHQRANLNTSTARIPAISLYLAFGFVPTARTDLATTRRAWQLVREQIEHPALDHFLATLEA